VKNKKTNKNLKKPISYFLIILHWMDRGQKRTHDEAEEEEEEVDDVLEDDLFDDDEEEEGKSLKQSGSAGGGELFSPASKEKAKILLKSPWRDRIFVVPGRFAISYSSITRFDIVILFRSDPVPDSAQLVMFPHARAGMDEVSAITKYFKSVI
jgi:hypothetical protein